VGFDAIRDEKDPLVLSYVENLRRQVAAITGKYGLRAVDVLTREGLDRMSVNDVAEAEKLVERIEVLSAKGKNPKARVEFRHEVERLDRRAREVFDEVKGCWDSWITGSNFEELARDCLRAGLPEEAERLAKEETWARPDRMLLASILTAKGRFLEAIHLIRDTIDGNENRLPPLLDALDGHLRSLTNLELEEEPDRYKIGYGLLCPAATSRLHAEFINRGYEGIPSCLMELQSVSDRIGSTIRGEGIMVRLNFTLVMAEQSAHMGINWQLWYDQARMIASESEVTNARMFDGDLAKTAGKIKGAALVRTFDQSAWLHGARGCIEAGRFDDACEILRAMSRDAQEWSKVAANTVAAMHAANQIKRANRVRAEFVTTRHIYLAIPRERLIALARRGEDVLDDAREEMERLTDDPSKVALTIAKVAIATMGFANAMKNRLAI
jgi:hypothetical protein